MLASATFSAASLASPSHTPASPTSMRAVQPRPVFCASSTRPKAVRPTQLGPIRRPKETGDDVFGGAPRAMISDASWQRYGDPQARGRLNKLRSSARTIGTQQLDAEQLQVQQSVRSFSLPVPLSAKPSPISLMPSCTSLSFLGLWTDGSRKPRATSAPVHTQCTTNAQPISIKPRKH